MLKDKYQSLLDLGSTFPISNAEIKEEAGKLHIKGSVPYAFDKDRFWDKLKTYANWDKEVSADLKVERTDVYGYYTIKAGDSLSKLAKGHLGDGNRYMEIFNLNKDILKDPDKIMAGQKIKLPPK